MIVRYFSFVIVLIILATEAVFSQVTLFNKEEKDMLQKAEYYFQEGDYRNIPRSLDLFEQLERKKPNDPYYKLMVGICYTYFKNKKEEGIEKLLEVKKINSTFNETNRYIGRAYAVNHQFDSAVVYYQKYLEGQNVTSKDMEEVRLDIFYCQNAKSYVKDSMSVEIKNIGRPINTVYSEYGPAITPDESMLIYTYRGENSKGGLRGITGKPDKDGQYYEDVMVSYRFGDEWLEPESIGNNINTEGHDAAISLSVDGQKLFIYKQEKKGNGDIYISELNGEIWSKPKRLSGLVNTEAWEGSASLTSNGQVLYFASDRSGGFGGRDLYSAKLQSDGSWGEVKNLGAAINTNFDDDAPFIHPDNRTLYFSSKGLNSMGGYDIFFTYLDDNDGWDVPENIGYPVNSIDDDRFYVLSADAKTGYYSTTGLNETGTHDIYTVSPGHFGKRPILALVVGVTKANGDPAEADVTVINNETDQVENKFKSNSASGKYVLALTPGNKYKIAIEVEGYQPKIDYIDVNSLETYVQVKHDFNFYSKDVDENVVVDEGLGSLQAKINNQIKKYKYENTKEGHDDLIYNMLLKDRGDEKNEEVDFFLDGDFLVDGECVDLNDESVTSKTVVITNPDGTTKKMIGPFETLLKAEIFKQDLLKSYSSCIELEAKVVHAGEEKTMKEYYAKEYTRNEFFKDIDASIHNELTQSDSLINEAEKIVDLEDEEEIDLSKEEALDNAVKEEIVGLAFKVEIGAVENPEDFKLGYLEKYGKITAKKYPDGKTRYTFGTFETLEKAEKFKEMLKEKEDVTEESFVTVFVFGQRKVVGELSEVERKEIGIDSPLDIEGRELTLQEKIDGVINVNSENLEEVVEKSGVIDGQNVVDNSSSVKDVKIGDLTVERENVVDGLIVEKEELAEAQMLKSSEPCGDDMKDFSWFVGKDLNNKEVYQKLIDQAASSCAEGLDFRVQIGAYRFPKNFKWDHLKQYSTPIITAYPDGITRFTQGVYETIVDAEVLRQKIIQSGQKDAWITPFYNGKRMFLEDLIKVNFYGRTIN